jgi:hypothetical protein
LAFHCYKLSHFLYVFCISLGKSATESGSKLSFGTQLGAKLHFVLPSQAWQIMEFSSATWERGDSASIDIGEAMKITYNPKVDVLRLLFSNAPIEKAMKTNPV